MPDIKLAEIDGIELLLRSLGGRGGNEMREGEKKECKGE